MVNQNSPRYLDATKQALFEVLRDLPEWAPSAQFKQAPRDAIDFE
jgi:hypothetical protein